MTAKELREKYPAAVRTIEAMSWLEGFDAGHSRAFSDLDSIYSGGRSKRETRDEVRQFIREGFATTAESQG